MGGRAQVSLDVVVRDGCLRWHATTGCDTRDAREGGFAFRCTLADAHASRLVPCPTCAGDLVALATTVWGPHGPLERARLPLPRLVDLATGMALLGGAPSPSGPSRTWAPVARGVTAAVAAHP